MGRGGVRRASRGGEGLGAGSREADPETFKSMIYAIFMIFYDFSWPPETSPPAAWPLGLSCQASSLSRAFHEPLLNLPDPSLFRGSKEAREAPGPEGPLEEAWEGAGKGPRKGCSGEVSRKSAR